MHFIETLGKTDNNKYANYRMEDVPVKPCSTKCCVFPSLFLSQDYFVSFVLYEPEVVHQDNDATSNAGNRIEIFLNEMEISTFYSYVVMGDSRISRAIFETIKISEKVKGTDLD